MNNFKIIVTAAITAAVVLTLAIVGARLVGNQSAEGDILGAIGLTRFPNSGLVARALRLSSNPATVTSLTDNSLDVDGTATFDGLITNTGGATFTGDTNVANLIGSGSTALGTTATTSLTAAQLCGDVRTITRSPLVAAASTTLPTATSLFSDCLDTAYDQKEITFMNIATTAASSTVLVAGSASTTFIGAYTSSAAGAATSTLTLSGGESATLRFVQTGATTNTVFVTEFASIP